MEQITQQKCDSKNSMLESTNHALKYKKRSAGIAAQRFQGGIYMQVLVECVHHILGKDTTRPIRFTPNFRNQI